MSETKLSAAQVANAITALDRCATNQAKPWISGVVEGIPAIGRVDNLMRCAVYMADTSLVVQFWIADKEVIDNININERTVDSFYCKYFEQFDSADYIYDTINDSYARMDMDAHNIKYNDDHDLR